MSDATRVFHVQAVYVSSNFHWPISVVVAVDARTPEQVRDKLDFATAWLLQNGFKPGPISGTTLADLRPGGQTNEPPMSEQEAIPPVWDGVIPICPFHGEEMKKSNVQKREGQTNFFCTKQEASGYCKHRGAILNTGGISLWTVD